MATLKFPLFTNAASADTNATPNTMVLRDNSGTATNSAEIINGNLYYQTANRVVKSVSTNTNIDNSAGTWNTTGTITLTLPAVAGVLSGREYKIYKTDTSTTVTINCADSANINGSSTTTLTTQYSSKTFFTDGVNWYF